MTAKHQPAPRRDRRFKDPESAPLIVNEKRMTLFMEEEMFRLLRMHTGWFRTANAMADNDSDDTRLPETPSSMARVAIEYWLDLFRPEHQCSRTPAQWAELIASIRRVLKSR